MKEFKNGVQRSEINSRFQIPDSKKREISENCSRVPRFQGSKVPGFQCFRAGKLESKPFLSNHPLLLYQSEIHHIGT
jgi:hypothetical protein